MQEEFSSAQRQATGGITGFTAITRAGLHATLIRSGAIEQGKSPFVQAAEWPRYIRLHRKNGI